MNNLITEATCFKSQNQTIVDFILNFQNNFMKTTVLKIDISDHQEMTFSILRHTLPKTHLKLFTIEILKTRYMKILVN